ncbi:MAG: hypothetical protein IIZ40_02475 [Bacilli bacterium]|nr:hypothetical protein [Bacilli bacterium]
MTEKDIRELNKYIKGEEIETSIIESLEKKLDLIVKQMDLRDKFNSDMEEISKEMEKIK